MSRHVEGPFFRTAKNTWYCTHQGRKVSLRVSGRNNKKAAIEAWHRLVRDGRPDPVRLDALTVGEAVTAFLKVVPVKPSTRALYADHLASLTKKVGRCPVARLTKEVLTDRLASLKVGSTTQKIRLSSVGSFLGWCVREGHIDRNPVHRMTKPKGRSRGTSAIVSPDAHAKLLALARPEMRVVLTLLYLTGARPGEVCAITAENFDPAASVVRLTEHKADRTGRDRIIYRSR